MSYSRVASLSLVMSHDKKNILDANTRNYWNSLTETLEKQNWIHNITFNVEF
jgi:hypothetical protein